MKDAVDRSGLYFSYTKAHSNLSNKHVYYSTPKTVMLLSETIAEKTLV